MQDGCSVSPRENVSRNKEPFTIEELEHISRIFEQFPERPLGSVQQLYMLERETSKGFGLALRKWFNRHPLGCDPFNVFGFDVGLKMYKHAGFPFQRRHVDDALGVNVIGFKHSYITEYTVKCIRFPAYAMSIGVGSFSCTETNDYHFCRAGNGRTKESIIYQEIGTRSLLNRIDIRNLIVVANENDCFSLVTKDNDVLVRNDEIYRCEELGGWLVTNALLRSREGHSK